MKALLVLMISLLAYSKNITYTVGGNDYEGYIINQGKNAPTVLIIHDWDGITDYEIKRAQMFKELGYSVFAADMYGKGIRPAEIPERKKMTKSLYDNRIKMRELLNEAINEAQKQGLNTKQMIAVGYCFGGTSVLELARSGKKLTGFVSFHGGLETPEGQSYKGATAPITIFHGTADTAVTMDHFANIAKEMEENNVPHEMITYSGAPHAFSVFGSERYRKDADMKSWKRLTEILKEQFKK
ncbi:dienelactone hydrolase family protein [Bacteriovorax sp. Seq25_V]|uniref:dienelactone hydrolase family protein n=1 Tax=Bacteriovorax sp. Seq25_V TaxID=1201288 RepID=UPI000389F8C9|nr:dienelactone hydrolase family protein [Bacteriovorax sp. Seq25_V]EQC47418.1 dienelactone hydrolase family protein [Bacteriovorax sp. Seq25_V]